MNFIELDMKLPEEFYELEKIMKDISHDFEFFIGGGSISNLYMGLPIRDIDIFYTRHFEKKDIEEAFGGYDSVECHERELSGYEDEPTFWEDPYLFRLTYKGYKVELIRSPKDRIYEFDLRFRQFYLLDGKVLATEEAINDIKNKEIVVANPHNPFSTLFRLYRFEEELGFTIREKSKDFLLWAFDQRSIRVDYAREYLIKNAHKTSERVIEQLNTWIDHTREEETGTYRGKEMIIRTDVPYPFHEETENVIKGHFFHNRANEVAINYQLLEDYKPMEKMEFEITIPFSKIERKVNWFINKLKTVRTKYIVSPDQTEEPYPIIKTGELPKKYQHYFKENFLTKIARYFYEKEEYKTGTIIESINILPEKVKVTIEPVKVINNLGDYLEHNVLQMTIGENFSYLIRKCTNGKYTIADVGEQYPNGAGFYLQTIGDIVKDEIPSFFDFRNEQLVAIYRSKTHGFWTDYFFGSEVINKALTKSKQLVHYVPISKQNLEEKNIA